MTTTKERGFYFWALQGPGWILLIWLIYAQGISAFGYELGCVSSDSRVGRMGTVFPPERVPKREGTPPEFRPLSSTVG